MKLLGLIHIAVLVPELHLSTNNHKGRHDNTNESKTLDNKEK